jgi:hypothetical protein
MWLGLCLEGLGVVAGQRKAEAPCLKHERLSSSCPMGLGLTKMSFDPLSYFLKQTA